MLSGPQISGLFRESSVGPDELNASKTSVAWLMAPTVKAPVESPGVSILPALTRSAEFVILFPSVSIWKK